MEESPIMLGLSSLKNYSFLLTTLFYLNACTNIASQSNPPPSTPNSANKTTRLAQGKVTTSAIVGTWKSDCIQTSRSLFWIQNLTFQNTGLYSETLYFSDPQCRIVSWKEERISEFALNLGSPPNVILSESVVSLKYAAYTPAMVTTWNQGNFCLENHWKINQSLTFSDPQPCSLQTPDLYMEIYGTLELHLKASPNGAALTYTASP